MIRHRPRDARRAVATRRHRPSPTARLSAFLLAVLVAAPAASHEFTVGLLVGGPLEKDRMAEVIAGFLLGADERDGHSGETSDGHLGGVDVQVLPLPRTIGRSFEGLAGTPAEKPDIIVVFDPVAAPGPDGPDGPVVMRSGALPDGSAWRSGSFAQRYQSAFGAAPGRDAAQGYNAARRLDLAIRPLDGLTPRPDLIRRIEATAEGIEW